MLTLKCTTMSCAHRSKCRVVQKHGTMVPRMTAGLESKYTLICHSERITRDKSKKQAGKSVVKDKNVTTATDASSIE